MNALMELRGIAVRYPGMGDEIEAWIKRHVTLDSIHVELSPAESPEHQHYLIEDALRKLGTHIAKRMNPYPAFTDDGRFKSCRLQVVGFKNEFGK